MSYSTSEVVVMVAVKVVKKEDLNNDPNADRNSGSRSTKIMEKHNA